MSRTQPQFDSLSTGEHILSFFQSLVPGYDPLAAVNRPPRHGRNREDEGDGEEGAVGGAVNRFDARQLMATLRDFLANMDQDRAGGGGGGAGAGNEPEEPQDLDEFD
jgi:hypothetical protein